MATAVMPDSFVYAVNLKTQARWVKSKQLHHTKERRKTELKKLLYEEQV